MKFTSGFCGTLLVRTGKGEELKRVTYREKAHRNCPVVIAGCHCECSCHSGGSPWDEIGVGPGRAESTVIYGPKIPNPTPSLTPPVTLRIESRPPVRERGTDMIAEMNRILDDLEGDE